MKINDVEKQLGITKANIRFYEKEGLLTPGRSENGYREYSEADIARLKEIVIYRKLGIPVQQIEDILDGAVSLQEALDTNITALNAEIEKLNGSLALCKQLKAEDARTLDIERYWEIIHKKEMQGFRFQSLLQDYAKFMEPTLDRYLMHVPAKHDRNPHMILKYTALLALGWGFFYSILTGDFIGSFTTQFTTYFVLVPLGFLIWCVAYIPAYLVGRKHPRLGMILKGIITAAVLLGAVIFFVYFGLNLEYA